MRLNFAKVAVCGFVLSLFASDLSAHGQTPVASYPRRAPVAEYMMTADDETKLARSAAPSSVSGEAQVLLLDNKGFHTTVKGSNGWACLVQRSWNAAVDFPEFWNPKIRAPICLNPAAVRSVLPVIVFWSRMVSLGMTQTQMAAKAKAAFDSGMLPPLAPQAMSFMMSKDQYLTDDAPRFHPHVMFFAPLGEGARWGANLAGSPIFAGEDRVNRMTILPVPVPMWSDGSLDSQPAR